MQRDKYYAVKQKKANCPTMGNLANKQQDIKSQDLKWPLKMVDNSNVKYLANILSDKSIALYVI